MYVKKKKPPPKKKKVAPPLANPAYAHELLLRNLFENPPWQTIDCVYTLYVYALQNLFKGQKMTKIVAQHPEMHYNIYMGTVFKYYVTICVHNINF